MAIGIRKSQSQRAEKIERNFAYQLDPSGIDRLYLRGQWNVHKTPLLPASACNLAPLLRSLHGAGKPKSAHDLKSAAILAHLGLSITLLESACVNLSDSTLPRLEPNHQQLCRRSSRGLVKQAALRHGLLSAE
jgi:hypothetical protein